MTPPSAAQPASKDSRDLARGGLASFFGASISAIMGFVLIVVLARTLGDAGSGVVLQAIAIFAIVLSFARSGMDSAAVWIMPRLAATNAGQIRSALGFMFVTTTVVGLICGAVTIALAPLFALTGDTNGLEVANAISVVGWFIPVGALLLVALSATRGLGGVWPYVSVGSIALPTVRPIVVGIAAITGGSLVMVTLGWAAPLPFALAAALIVLRFQVHRHERAVGVHGTFLRAPKSLRKKISSYAIPRVISAGLQQSVLWLDVLIVGIVGGSAAAGVYGGASRFIAAGLIIDTALRIVIAPQFSTLLAQGKLSETTSLYRTAATWLVLFSTPIYIILAFFAPVVLSWLGPAFVRGAPALVVLCVGLILTFVAGNIDTVLLMSGRSSWDALNKTIVLMINIAGNIILIPMIGIVGAAITWALSMLVNATLAAIEVQKFIGISIGVRTIGYALLVPALTVGLPAAILVFTVGASIASMFTAIGIGAVLFVTWCAFDRKRLHLHGLALLARHTPESL